MYGKFLGIDFGNDEIKVAVINRTLREEKLEEYYSIAVPSNVSDEDATFKASLEEHSVTKRGCFYCYYNTTNINKGAEFSFYRFKKNQPGLPL